ncbi:hypothetical protein [Microbulbifer hydrolyticus]|uniref:Uncharacterized protein n=1 Tax=Microbulbifer hydrolyticus TaxID=48074 RepID=A0A6P1TC92_9GAMM|nr:hypothetical protein [Microbulbifer hydrolyticus]MBB5210692.1 hypothetical protein [Microbulbifer hydrolyticus]QHQ38849.1 hypothetical protein GTQ55_07545 [Microbulbifer hydrolyticus]
MAVNRGCALFFAGVLGVFGWCGLVQAASSLTVEQNKLARMEQSQENRLVELEDVENEMLAYEYKLQRAQESLLKARANYAESLKALKSAEREHNLGATSDTERALHKAKHAYAMAERGVDSRNRRVEIIQSTFGELESRLKASQGSVKAGESRLAEQQALVDKLVKSMLVKVESQKAAQEPAAAAPPPVSAPSVPAPSLASLEPVAPSIAEPEAAESDAEAAAEREIDPELMEYVRGERERLSELLGELEEGEEGKQTFRNLTLRPSDGDSVEFEFLGQNQYRLIAPVSAGRQTYKINSWRFRRTIPSDDDGERYVFIFDARRLARPRLVMYPEYVLSKLD